MPEKWCELTRPADPSQRFLFTVQAIGMKGSAQSTLLASRSFAPDERQQINLK
jgi:hypothetical protein